MLKSRQAFVYLHNQGLLVGSYSGPGAAVQEDWTQNTVWLDSLEAVEPHALGSAIRVAWTQCQYIPLVPYQEVLAKHSEAVGAPNIKRLFAGVKLVSPHLKDGVITVDASKQTAPGEYDPIPSSVVKLSEQASDEELGAAVIQALHRCE